MNGAALAHHTKLIDWCAQKQRRQNPKAPQVLHKSKQSRLSADKCESIGRWCAEVNRLFIKAPEPEPPQLFRKCKYSDAMFPPNKSTSKSKAVNPPAALWTRPGKKNEVKRVMLSGQVGFKSRPTEHYMEDEKNMALSAKMADTHDHYIHERKTVHINIQPEFKRKLSTGWTINRPMLYPKVPPPPPPENLLVDIPDYLVKNEENRMEVCQESSSQRRASSASNAEKFDVPKIMDVTVNVSHAEKVGVPHVVGITEAADVQENGFYTDSDSEGDFKSKGTQCVPPSDSEPDLQKNEGEERQELQTPDSRYKPIITDRSTSNTILNVLSVDDCKMVMRYRPVRVVDTQDSMILPPPKSSQEKDSESEEVSREDTATTTLNTPIRLSQGSDRTTLTPKQLKSRVNAFREMYDTYSKTTPEAKVLRPSSAAVEKAFDVLLDKEFQACQSSRRPLSCPPPKDARSRPSSRNSNHSGSTAPSTPGSGKFQQLNATLRKQMYDFLDSRWHSTKMKFQRSKNGYSKSAMKKARMVTSSPKDTWMSDEELVK